MKYVVFLGDGMADLPVEALDGKTPLEAAAHPNMDRLAQCGEYGMVRTVPAGMKPGSDTANLAVFGYDPRVYYSGRSPLEAASIGIELAPEDVAYRCNFVTLSSESGTLADAHMRDYSAGEITSVEAAQLVAAFNARFQSQTVQLYAGISYRQCLVLRHAETGAELTQPHDIPGQPVSGRLPQGAHAEQLTEMIRWSFENFPAHPVNLARVAAGKHPATAVWFWGEGRRPALTPFKQRYHLHGAVISAVDLIQGIGKCAGLDVIRVPGATGTFHTDFAAKGRAAIDALQNGADYVYIHVEAPDECGHQHQIREKVYAIEQIDQKIVGPVLDALDASGEPYAALLLPDHPTPLSIRTHTGDPVPFVLYRSGMPTCRKLRYTEADAAKTGLMIEEGHTLLSRMLERI